MTDDMGPFSGMDPALERAITFYGTPPRRQIVTVSIEDISHYRFDNLPDSINGWIDWLKEARKKAPEKYRDCLQCVLTWEDGYYDSGDSANLRIWYERPETDEEMTERVESGIAYIRNREAKEREAYERLKRKFESR